MISKAIEYLNKFTSQLLNLSDMIIVYFCYNPVLNSGHPVYFSEILLSHPRRVHLGPYHEKTRNRWAPGEKQRDFSCLVGWLDFYCLWFKIKK